MDFLKLFRGSRAGKVSASVQDGSGGRSYSANDPRLLEEIRGALNGKASDALLNGAINRSIRLLSESIGMLPLHLHWQDAQKGKATDHPLYTVLAVRPNNWQTPFEFKRLMQATMLRNGAAYAQIVRSMGRVTQLQPLTKYRVEPKQAIDWSISYELTSPTGVKSTLKQSDIFVIRDLDIDDGISGSSRVRQARDAIRLSNSIRVTTQKLFDNGMHVGGAFQSPNKLSPEARAHLKESFEKKTGSENAGKWLLLEEGLEAKPFASSMKDSMQVDNLAVATEEIARIFGVPRPLLMMDETSWGSGIDALGLFFIQYGLAPQFVNWEQGIQRSLMSDEEAATYVAKFNDGALLRGSKKDQAEYFAKALGSGGSAGWMNQNEVRALNELPAVEGGDIVPSRAASNTGATNVNQNPA